jgi:hypothetical protein
MAQPPTDGRQLLSKPSELPLSWGAMMAAETLGSIIYEVRNMPWEYYFDSARHLYDKVIVPAHTFVSTAVPFARTGAKIVFADIDPDMRVLSAEMVKPCISSRTKAIVVVHLCTSPTCSAPLVTETSSCRTPTTSLTTW